MDFHFGDFLLEFEYRLNAFDLKGAAEYCNGFIAHLLRSGDVIPLKQAERVLQGLRRKRMFVQMQQLADTLIRTNRVTFKIRKLYAQAMIDLSNYTASICVLGSLIHDTEMAGAQDPTAPIENREARGLIGRVYKQLYMNAGDPANPQCVTYLKLSVNAYYEVYKADNSKVWHGINTVAMLERAKRDKISIDDLPEPLAMAKAILSLINKRYIAGEDVDAWDFATAAEACIALGNTEEALRWMSGYAKSPDCDAFELSSTLRQLEEVWQLDLTKPAGLLLLPILRAELVKRQGGSVLLDAETVKMQNVLDEKVTKIYTSLMREGKVDGSTTGKITLEKNFGEDSFTTYREYMLGAGCCLWVARIGLDRTKGKGTGFLIRGNRLKDSLGEQFYLLTNAHIISDDPAENALNPEDAIVTFEALDGNREYTGLKILWSSPSGALDATLLKFTAADKDRLDQLAKDAETYSVSAILPDPKASPKLFIIGHPKGGTLQLSLHDNLLLDHQAPRIHYRTPTEGGSSGSPVFTEQWKLIGLHHAGVKNMPCLNGKPGTYDANEGIWIQSMITALRERSDL